MKLLSKINVNSKFNLTLYPKILMLFGGFLIFFPPLFIIAPFFILRDVVFLKEQYNVHWDENRYIFYFSPLVFHALGLITYLFYRRNKLQEHFKITDTKLRKKQDDMGLEPPTEIHGALVVEVTLFSIAFGLIMFGFNIIYIAIVTTILILVGTIVNPILVYKDLKSLSEKEVPWSFQPKLLILLLSTSFVFLFVYTITRSEHVFQFIFETVRKDQQNYNRKNNTNTFSQNKENISMEGTSEQTEDDSIFKRQKEKRDF